MLTFYLCVQPRPSRPSLLSVVRGPVQDHVLLVAGLNSEKQLVSESTEKLLSTLFNAAEFFPPL